MMMRHLQSIKSSNFQTCFVVCVETAFPRILRECACRVCVERRYHERNSQRNCDLLMQRMWSISCPTLDCSCIGESSTHGHMSEENSSIEKEGETGRRPELRLDRGAFQEIENQDYDPKGSSQCYLGTETCGDLCCDESDM